VGIFSHPLATVGEVFCKGGSAFSNRQGFPRENAAEILWQGDKEKFWAGASRLPLPKIPMFFRSKKAAICVSISFYFSLKMGGAVSQPGFKSATAICICFQGKKF